MGRRLTPTPLVLPPSLGVDVSAWGQRYLRDDRVIYSYFYYFVLFRDLRFPIYEDGTRISHILICMLDVGAKRAGLSDDAEGDSIYRFRLRQNLFVD